MKNCRFLLLTLLMAAYQFGYTQTSNLAYTESYYVPAVNGTKLAVDVHFPKGYQNGRLPALLELTRYWRSAEDPVTGEPTPSLRKRDDFFLANNYILVKVDVRGTGASYGVRPGEYTRTEVRDARYILELKNFSSIFWTATIVG
ncbi:MAG: CocE/NonD family hydrolase [Saprospiraceae bacterium]